MLGLLSRLQAAARPSGMKFGCLPGWGRGCRSHQGLAHRTLLRSPGKRCRGLQELGLLRLHRWLPRGGEASSAASALRCSSSSSRWCCRCCWFWFWCCTASRIFLSFSSRSAILSWSSCSPCLVAPCRSSQAPFSSRSQQRPWTWLAPRPRLPRHQKRPVDMCSIPYARVVQQQPPASSLYGEWSKKLRARRCTCGPGTAAAVPGHPPCWSRRSDSQSLTGSSEGASMPCRELMPASARLHIALQVSAITVSATALL